MLSDALKSAELFFFSVLSCEFEADWVTMTQVWVHSFDPADSVEVLVGLKSRRRMEQAVPNLLWQPGQVASSS